LILYGRGAIWLGFSDPPIATATTQDVDAIIPEAEVEPLAHDASFWDARDRVNDLLKSEGLYITHLFPESAVFLRRDWMKHIVPITSLQLNQLTLFRPAAIDLVLTKMMRGTDEQDMADAAFIIRHDQITQAQLSK